MCAYYCTQLSYTTQHRTIMIFSLLSSTQSSSLRWFPTRGTGQTNRYKTELVTKWWRQGQHNNNIAAKTLQFYWNTWIAILFKQNTSTVKLHYNGPWDYPKTPVIKYQKTRISKLGFRQLTRYMYGAQYMYRCMTYSFYGYICTQLSFIFCISS